MRNAADGLGFLQAVVDAEHRPYADPPRTWGTLVINGRLGGGTFGDVYRAHDPRLDRELALKLPRPERDAAADEARLWSEACHLARVHHPNVVGLYGADRVGGRVGLCMELVSGMTLEELLQRHGTLGGREASVIGIDVCRGTAAMHDAGLLHGDIKAHNVMRDDDGRIVLMDFGAAKDLRQKNASPDLAGTPVYLAPEVFAGAPRTTAVDIYSIGVLLFHLLTDRYPVEGETHGAIMEAHQQCRRAQLRDLRADLPGELVTIVECALAPDPRQRFQSAGQFGRALADSLKSVSA